MPTKSYEDLATKARETWSPLAQEIAEKFGQQLNYEREETKANILHKSQNLNE